MGLAASINAHAQVIVSSLEDALPQPPYEAQGIISDVLAQDTDGLLADWSSTLGEFTDIESALTEAKASSQRTAGTAFTSYRTVTVGVTAVNAPVIPGDNGEDLYMLTEEGITLYMAALAPVYYQETTQDIIRWIRYYASQKRERTLEIFKRYADWEPYLRRAFEASGLPPEICELCMIESGCSYTATSSAGARGMWQIMPDTAREHGMTVNDSMDERTDPVASTFAAIKILCENYEATKEWTLAIAAYNCGAARTARLVREKGSVAWPLLKKYFPRETQQYIPSLLAMHYVWSYRKELGFKI